MKKIITSLFLMLAVLTASATDYKGQLSVTVAGETADQGEATISVEEADGKYNFVLKNFSFTAGETTMGIGNIEINGLEGTTEGDAITFDASVTATVTDGDEGTTWWGPTLLGDGLPVDIKGTMTATQLEAQITINFAGMEIVVNFTPESNEKSYTGNLSVTVAGETSDQGEATISVVEADGKYTMTLRNFSFTAAGYPIAIGNIVIADLEGTTTEGTTTFDASVTATVTDGDEGTSWWGPSLFGDGLPVEFKGTMSDTDLTATITMSYSGLDIVVNFGQKSDAISSPTAAKTSTSRIFDAAGRQVESLQKGQIYIEQHTDGTSTKFVAE